ncbi:MAG: thiolase family protein [Bacteriovoracaceae bacterium]|jgi:acetyl-CoA acetyltransferase family protein|nr:thiolase family protein [Bacteriovoracaceae bacterium]
MSNTYLIYAKRTPIARIGGSLSKLRPDDMIANLLIDFKNQCSFDLKEIDDVIVGCANQAGEDNRNIARMATILAEYPFEVPGVTINRLCASSLDGLIDATARIQAGFGDCYLVGGVESMTRGPLVLSKPSSSFGRDSKMYDTTFGWRFPNPKMENLIPLYGMGETAEEVADQYKISREQQDKFAYDSQMKAVRAWDQNLFDDEVITQTIKLRKKTLTVERDECPRADTSLELLAKLRPAFRKDGTVTAGNSSTMNDGAALLAVVSEEFLKRHKLTPVLNVTGGATRGVHPNTMGLGPIESTKRLMKRFNKKISDFDIVELNEAFAAQSLACIEGLDLDPKIVNPLGGAIALGHPLGCSGARIVTTLFHQMNKDKNLKQALASMCVGVGQGVSVSFENC